MNAEDLKKRIETIVPEAEFVENKQYVDVIVPTDKLHNLAKNLKESEDTAFDYLFCLSGVDWVKHLMVVYHITSSKHGHSIVLKVKTEDRENPSFDTVCDIWTTAEFHEREAFDMFGIKFNNHPDMRRIFLCDDWIGYPLRKDYVDEKHIIER